MPGIFGGTNWLTEGFVDKGRDVDGEVFQEHIRSTDLGFLGYVDGDKVELFRSPTKRHTASSEFDLREIDILPTVEIVHSYIQPSGTVIEALAAAGVDGIVVAATGGGLISSFEKSALKSALSRSSWGAHSGTVTGWPQPSCAKVRSGCSSSRERNPACTCLAS